MKESTQINIPPVTKSLEVNLPVEDAFRLFTAGIGTWWPIRSHSVGEDRASTCRMEGRVGGRFYEIQEDGTEVLWGTVLSWEPPRRLVFSWHPGYEVEQAQEVEVTFEADGDGSRLHLVHRGWEERVKVHPEVRDGYEAGWDIVLGKYLARTAEDR
ncbi:MAG: SRPBCC domain-containing protein [Anaerolineales bacterium]|nr:SRPBCC domain-containing protein [Anaerolineales bacterium]